MRRPRRLQAAVVTAPRIDGQLTTDAWRAFGAPIAISEDGLALKGLTPTATIPADPDVESCLASTRARRFFTGESSTGQRHDDTGSPLPDHTCQFQAHPLLGRNGNRLAVDELAQHLDFQITQFGLHQLPLRSLRPLSRSRSSAILASIMATASGVASLADLAALGNALNRRCPSAVRRHDVWSGSIR
jgi:hypothetical protein